MSLIRKTRRHFLRFSCTIILLILSFSISNIIYESLPFNQIQSLNCSDLCPYSSTFTNDTLDFDSTYNIRHFPDFVCPQNFRNLADWIYGWPDQFLEHVGVTTDQGKHIAPCLPSGSIIYVRIWIINQFFIDIYPHLQNDFVLITGEGDVSSPSNLELLDAPDSKIIHWFGQNGQYDVSKSKKFTHLPIGEIKGSHIILITNIGQLVEGIQSKFENIKLPICSGPPDLSRINCYEMADAIRSIYSQHPNHTRSPIFDDLDEPSSYIQLRDVSHRALTTNISNKDLVLLNFDPGTDTSRFRSHLLKTMCNPKNKENFTYAACIVKPNGIHIEKLPQIYVRNRRYPFWLSPRGGGLDCHRTWEALYLDIIPIVWNSSLNVLYENLPVVIINSYEELNDRFLYKKLNEISRKKLSREKEYEFEKLYNAYWRRLILDKSRHRQNKNVHKRRNQCWRAKRTINWKRLLPFL